MVGIGVVPKSELPYYNMSKFVYQHVGYIIFVYILFLQNKFVYYQLDRVAVYPVEFYCAFDITSQGVSCKLNLQTELIENL